MKHLSRAVCYNGRYLVSLRNGPVFKEVWDEVPSLEGFKIQRFGLFWKKKITRIQVGLEILNENCQQVHRRKSYLSRSHESNQGSEGEMQEPFWKMAIWPIWLQQKVCVGQSEEINEGPRRTGKSATLATKAPWGVTGGFWVGLGVLRG